MTPLPDFLLRPILANPADDLLRLAAADWWEENGESERAEFVRRQIIDRDEIACPSNAPSLYHERFGIDESIGMTISRGFPSAVYLAMGQFMGGECQRCVGGAIEFVPPCESCHGTGRTPGLAKWIGENWPVERVGFSDAEPNYNHLTDSWYWMVYLTQVNEPTTGWLPPEFGVHIESAYSYPTRDLAISVLSAAAVRHMRRLAGLDHADSRAAALTAPRNEIRE